MKDKIANFLLLYRISYLLALGVTDAIEVNDTMWRSWSKP